MHVLVTGASSFVGRHVAVALSRAGFSVTATYRSGTPMLGRLNEASPEICFVRLDLSDEAGFVALPETIDHIVHVAGVSATPDVTLDDILACNVAGARNLLKYAERANPSRIILASTLSVHGDVEEGVVTESTPVRAPDIYGASKFLAERLFAAESHWLPCVAIRLPGVLGKGAHRAWIPTLLERLRNGDDVTIYNPKAMFNNAAHVSDLCKMLLLLLQGEWSGFHGFPVGAASQIAVADVVELLRSATSSCSRVLEGVALKKHFVVSSAYARETFGYDPMDIRAMLQRYVTETASIAVGMGCAGERSIAD